MKNSKKYSFFKMLFLLPCLSILTSCAYQSRAQPINLPSNAKNPVVINGLHISAVAFENRKMAREAFGFDIRKAGILPVQIVFQNEGDNAVRLIPDQTFLLDSSNKAWPINSLKRTYGFPEEAQNATKLKITLLFGGKFHAATINLLP